MHRFGISLFSSTNSGSKNLTLIKFASFASFGMPYKSSKEQISHIKFSKSDHCSNFIANINGKQNGSNNGNGKGTNFTYFDKRLLLSFWLPFFGSKEEEPPQDPIKHTMKLALISIEDGNFEEAEEHLHDLLHLIQEQFDSGEITEREFLGKRAHVYSTMANVGLLAHNTEKAEKLLKDMLKDCIACGIDPQSALVVEVSLKLALIYAKIGDVVKAETGFRFCVECQESKMAEWADRDDQTTSEENEEDLMNEKALLGMTRNYYARFLHEQGRLKEALLHSQKALGLAMELYGEVHGNVMNLLNDVGVLYSEMGDTKVAEEYLRKAIKISEREVALVSHLPILYTNLGDVMGSTNREKEAREMIGRARRIMDNLEVPKDHPMRAKVESTLQRIASAKKSTVPS